MVRINLIDPKCLTDQHLVAEYVEILILFDYARRYPSLDGIPSEFCLGKGHIKFFKDKLKYLKNRFESIKEEMNNRNFCTRKNISLKDYKKYLLNDWTPDKKDFQIIRNRITDKINLKPDFYRYYGEYKPKKFLINLLN